ncbi:MAG: DNA-binding protein [Mycoplasmatales bacterium]|nr:DNA-binding protein [Mycoplasmatales bacterium]
MEYKKINNVWALKISRGESVLESIKKIVFLENIKFAKIEAIGAVKNVEIGYMNNDGSYKTKKFDDEYEVLSLKGSIAGEGIIHMHISLSDSSFQTIGGHFFNAETSGVVEMFITEIHDKKINKIQKNNDLFPTWDLEEYSN